MNLTPEQLAYLKSLESPKERRKFMLDCLVENVLGESVKFEEEINRLNITYQTSTTPEAFKGLLQFCGASEDESDKKENQHLTSENYDFNLGYEKAIENLNKEESLNKKCCICQMFDKMVGSEKCMSCDAFLRHHFENNKFAKTNYTPEEIEIAKSLNSEREEKKWTDEDMIRAFEKGNYATCNAFTLREKPSEEQLNLYIELKNEFIKSFKND